MESIDNFKIIDSFKNIKTKNILYGNKDLNDFGQKTLYAVVNHYLEHRGKMFGGKDDDMITDEFKQLVGAEKSGQVYGGSDKIGKIKVHVKNVDDLYKNSSDYKDFYTKIKQKLNVESFEAVMSYLLLAFAHMDNTLLIRTLNVFGRVTPFDTKNEWLDNWRENSYGNCLNMIQWKDFDNNDNFTISRERKPINSNITFSESELSTILRFIVGTFRTFLIKNNMSPTDYQKQSDQKLSDLEICDKCYELYPFNWIGSHGCNSLYEGNWTVHIDLISKFLDRYPSAILGGVFNTAQYGMQGEHWMALLYYRNLEIENGKKGTLICSCGSDWSAFKGDASKIIMQKHAKNKIASENNSITIQRDGYNCGVYSIISILSMLIKDMDVLKTVEFIGENGKNMFKEVFGDKSKFDINSIRQTIIGTKK